MPYLKSNAQCVWYWQSFKAMRWPSRLMDISVLLAPLCLSLAFWGDWERGLGWRVASTVIIALLWLKSAELVSRYVRGWRAEQRGVQITSNPEKPDFVPNTSLLIVSGAGVCLGIFELANTIGRGDDRLPLQLTFLFLGMFFLQLSAYPRARLYRVAQA